MPYAEKTKVPINRSRDELERLLRKQGAAGFASAWDSSGDKVEFLWKGLRIRFHLPYATLPKARSQAAREQADRRRWRALVLVVKAKLEAVNSGIAIFEHEFLGNIVDEATDRTVGEIVVRRIAEGGGHLRALLPASPEGARDEG